ncbi:MAG: polysaccharide pyruvyl transferase CsaB [Candidatus Firestonebacteria bacterium]
MSENRKKILIFGYFGFGNTGDELILLSLVNHLKDNARISVLSANPEKTSNEFKVKAVKRNNVFELVKEIFSSEILLGAGGLLQDKTSKKSIWYYLGLIFIGKILNKKVVLFSLGIGPINFSLNRWLTKKILKKVEVITLRDMESAAELKKIGVSKKMIVTGDAVFSLDFSGYERKTHRYFTLGVMLRKFKNYKFFAKEIKEVCDDLSKLKKIEFISFPFQPPEDNILPGRVIVLPDMKKLILKISSLDMVIGARYHSLILASVFNIPFIGINCDEKVKNFCGFLKTECLDLRKNDFKKRLKSSIIKHIGQDVKYDITKIKQKVEESFELIVI